MKYACPIVLILLLSPFGRCFAEATTRPLRIVRVAAIGEINDLGFWDALSQRFEKTTGIHVEVVSSGNKDSLPALFRQGVIDLLVMQSGDAVIDLVASNDALDAQPFLKSELLIVGPNEDPAGINGLTDASVAMKNIVESKSALVVHGNSGADSVVRGIVQSAGLQIDPQKVAVLLNDHQRQVLQAAVDKKAYTLISRVPFKSGKLTANGFSVMVEGDPRLQRPWLVAIANPKRFASSHTGEARTLAGFLRSDDAQRWIASFGKGKLDDRSLFAPVTTFQDAIVAATQPTPPLLSVVGQVPRPLFLDEANWKQLPRHAISVKVHEAEIKYEGVLVRDVLKSAGLSLGDRRMNRPNLVLYVQFEAADGYRAIFSLPEFDDDLAERSILLADQRDGQPLGEKEGAIRLVVPQENQQIRWVRQVRSVSVRVAE